MENILDWFLLFTVVVPAIQLARSQTLSNKFPIFCVGLSERLRSPTYSMIPMDLKINENSKQL